ncbi:MAG: CoA transferase [Chloroflexi bacterium]|nr:CoA transferase [Chloroflexota bacterium]
MGMLDGVRILDLTHVYAGPQGTQLLADMGAEVIKVEGPYNPDRGRGLLGLASDRATGAMPVGRPWFCTLNRNKKAVTLDLSKPRGKDLFRELVKVSDVVIENFSLRVMPNLGFDYPRLKEVNPQVIYIAMPGYGASGPYKNYVCWGEIIDSMCGLAGITGYPEGAPMRSNIAYGDPITGLNAALAILVCLHYRQRTGRGCYVDVSHLEAVTRMVGDVFMDASMNGRDAGRTGNRHPTMAPHNVYPCQGEDEWVAIAIADDEEWKAFCKALGEPAWAQRPEYATAAGRKQHEDAMDRHLAGWTRRYAKYEVMHRLQGTGVMAGAVLTVQDLVHDPHVQATGGLVEVAEYATPQGITYPQQGFWARASGAPPKLYRNPPGYGQHNDSVFGGLLALSAEELAELRKTEVIRDTPPKG